VEAGKVTLRVLLLGLALLLLAELAMAWFIDTLHLPSLQVIGIGRVVETGLIILIVAWLGGGLESIGLGRRQIFSGIIRGAVWSAGFGLAVLIGFGVMHLAGLNPLKMLQAPLPKSGAKIILYFLIGGIVAPISEEIFFRGLVYGYFRRWGIIAALLVSSGVFVLAHQPGRNLPVTQTLGGIVFALAYEVEGKLMAPIMIHLLGNMAIFVLALVF